MASATESIPVLLCFASHNYVRYSIIYKELHSELLCLEETRILLFLSPSVKRTYSTEDTGGMAIMGYSTTRT